MGDILRRRGLMQTIKEDDNVKIIADPTVLASGTIATTDVADNITTFSFDSSGNNQVDYVDTGLTLGDLRGWEVFFWSLRNDDDSRYYGMLFGTLKWPYSISNGFNSFMTWLDTDKTLLESYRGAVGNSIGLMPFSSAVGRGSSSASMAASYTPRQMLNITSPDATKIYTGILHRNGKGDRTSEIKWQIQGITRKE